MPIQAWIHHWEQGAGARLIKYGAAILAFVALAGLYDLFCFQNLPSEEGMETAQLARNLAEGKGYTTDSIRPFTLYLLQAAAEPGQSYKILSQRTPDLNIAPGYPVLLAGLMKILPFQFHRAQMFAYEPERWIATINQFLFFLSALVLFFLARRLFDDRVAWLSTILFAGSELFWRFTLSGLSTSLLVLIFLLIVRVLAAMENRDRSTTDDQGWRSLPLAALAGLLLGAGGLTRYAFAALLLPAAVFILTGIRRGRLKLTVAMLLVAAGVMAPWLVRNIALSGHCFGAAGYALEQGTEVFPDATLERTVDASGGLHQLRVRDLVNKFVVESREVYLEEMPKLGGTWIGAFFLVGLIIPFRNVGLTRLRWFVVYALFWFAMVAALDRTHLATDHPEINSENILILFSPVIMVYGVALFFSLLDRLELTMLDARAMIIGAFALMMCLPMVYAFLTPPSLSPMTPYSPAFIRYTAGWLKTNEYMISDIPSGVAWYGDRSCLWLPLDDDNQFFKLNATKPIHGLFLTQETANAPFLTEMKENTNSWGNFLMQAAEHQEVPTGFTLRKGPTGFLPHRLFLSDRARWRENAAKP